MLAAAGGRARRGGQARAGDVVVLLRASGDLEVFERALQLRGLRTLAAVGGFWGHQQVGDLLAYLRALANPLDELALYGMLASPLGGCSRDGLALLARRGAGRSSRRVGDGAGGARRRAASSHERLARRRSRGARARFCELLGARARGRAAAHDRRADRARDRGERLSRARARRWTGASGGWPTCTSCCASPAASKPARDATCAASSTTSPYLQDAGAARARRARRRGRARRRAADEHPRRQGPGVPGRLRRRPRAPAEHALPDLLVDGERLGAAAAAPRRRRRRARRSTTRSSASERRRREAEEEDRILYVAMTRARERLLLSGAVDFERWPRAGPGARADLLAGARRSPHELPELAAAGMRPRARPAVGPAGAVSVRCRLSSPAMRTAATPAPRAAPASERRAVDATRRGPAGRDRRAARAAAPTPVRSAGLASATARRVARRRAGRRSTRAQLHAR